MILSRIRIRSLHSSARFLKKKLPEVTAEPTPDISSNDLSSILLSSKIKVTPREIKHVDKDIPPRPHKRKPHTTLPGKHTNVEAAGDAKVKHSGSNYADTAKNKYKNDIINSEFIPDSIRNAIKESSGSGDVKKNSPSHQARATKLLNRKAGPPKAPVKKSGGAGEKSQEVFRETISVGSSENDAEKIIQVKPLESSKIPKLSHNLDRTLFSPGVHFLQDPRTRVFNFPPHLKKIIELKDFDPEKLEGFVPSSKDNKLLEEAKRQNKRFISSTSSMTGVLAQFYLLLNNYSRMENSDRFTFAPFFNSMMQSPASVIVQPRGVDSEGETIYSVESDKSTDQEIVLSAMGHVLETLLTTSQQGFEKFKKKQYGEEVTEETENDSTVPSTENTYNYSSYGNFLMRSQLDCYDERLPGNGTFDIKTRAVCAIRYDNANPQLSKNSYQIWKLRGQYESFDREYQDLIRTGALLKYGFQARIGQMDGIFVGYHNLNSFFGFEYLPLSEIDRVFFSHKVKSEYPPLRFINNMRDLKDDFPTFVAENQFKTSLTVWESIMNTIIEDLEESTVDLKKKPSFRLVFKTHGLEDQDLAREPFDFKISKKAEKFVKNTLSVMAVPITNEEVDELQSFPTAFKTSYKDEVPAEEKLTRLKDHRDSVIDFSKNTSVNGVFNYKVKIDHFVGNSTRVIYPNSESDKWRIRYKIDKMGNSPNEYRRLMEVRADSLVEHFERALKYGLTEHEEFSENIDEIGQEEQGLDEETAELSIEEEEQENEEIDENDDIEELEEMEEEEVTNSTSETNNLIHRLDEDKINCNFPNNDMRVFSAIGRIRAKKWESLEKNPVVYKPSDE